MALCQRRAEAARGAGPWRAARAFCHAVRLLGQARAAAIRRIPNSLGGVHPYGVAYRRMSSNVIRFSGLTEAQPRHLSRVLRSSQQARGLVLGKMIVMQPDGRPVYLWRWSGQPKSARSIPRPAYRRPGGPLKANPLPVVSPAPAPSGPRRGMARNRENNGRWWTAAGWLLPVRWGRSVSASQRRLGVVPEVGVESSAEALEIAVVHLTTQKKYPQSHPHWPWGYTALLASLSDSVVQ